MPPLRYLISPNTVPAFRVARTWAPSAPPRTWTCPCLTMYISLPTSPCVPSRKRGLTRLPAPEDSGGTRGKAACGGPRRLWAPAGRSGGRVSARSPDPPRPPGHAVPAVGLGRGDDRWLRGHPGAGDPGVALKQAPGLALASCPQRQGPALEAEASELRAMLCPPWGETFKAGDAVTRFLLLSEDPAGGHGPLCSSSGVPWVAGG